MRPQALITDIFTAFSAKTDKVAKLSASHFNKESETVTDPIQTPISRIIRSLKVDWSRKLYTNATYLYRQKSEIGSTI